MLSNPVTFLVYQKGFHIQSYIFVEIQDIDCLSSINFPHHCFMSEGGGGREIEQ